MRLVDAFKEFDKDADGMLSPEELLKWVEALWGGILRHFGP